MRNSTAHNEGSVQSVVSISHVEKWYGDHQALADISLEVGRRKCIVICGPSEWGKSTPIRCVSGLEQFQKETITVEGVQLGANLKDVKTVRQNAGMVFQQFNLFPHMTVLENCTLAPRLIKKSSRKEVSIIAMQFLEKVKIPEQAHKYPESGDHRLFVLPRCLRGLEAVPASLAASSGGIHPRTSVA